ncbi:restriction endonuclease [Burkholderia pseudomallei]|uniref:restriction endonuclease n=1 Tax=Burkholderia pseudomallei TaxID=28450 RepID=UPI00053651C2|nr:restriction endonuclease [Burkholderia pseudomallei]KGW60846.1 restriction endonuclease family protein [Burkholderia pseudomallei MSHR1029]
MTFPSDIKLAMRECILKLLWARDDIIGFFENNSCTKSDIKSLGDHKSLSRAAIVDSMFDHLSKRPDEGLGQFRSMLQSLIDWKHFDDYYFEKLKKLNRADADRAITHLQQLQEIRDHKLQQQRKERELKEAAAKAPADTLAELKTKFIGLLQGTVSGAKRGYALEGILQSVAKLSALEVTEPFRVNGEQIDGAVKYDGEHYIMEAKWQDKAAANEAVYQFAAKIEGKMYGRGLFFSVQGFSDHVVTSLVQGKALKTVFVDGADLIVVLEGIIGFAEMLDRKIKAAQTKGLIYVDAVTGKSKL